MAALVVIVMILAQVWTEVLWYDQLGFLSVFTTEWLTRIGLFAGAAVVMAAIIWLNMWLAYRNRPVYAPATQQQISLDKFRETIDPLRKVLMIGLPIVIGLFAGVSAMSQWESFQLWLNQESFGVTDPQFGMDISFYAFTLPWLRFLVSFLMTTVVLAGLGAVLVHLTYGGLQFGEKTRGITPAARVQISVIAAILILLIGVNYWLDRYSMLLNQSEQLTGAMYTDVHAGIPAKEILAGISVLIAILFIVVAFKGNWKLPTAGVAVMVVAGLIMGWAYPAVIENFQVRPNAQTLEAEYISRNIDATKHAFGLDDVETTNYEAKTDAEPGALREDAETTTQIRLLDPTVVPPSFRQLQQNKQYYNFADTLSVDRYEIDGQSRDTVIGVRELDQSGMSDSQRTWVNSHIVYTHGYGVVAAYGNNTASEGRPAFYESGIPSTGDLGDYEPRIYFGQKSPDYSIVGAPADADPRELDYPDDDSATGQVNTTFTGDGGPDVGNWWNKLLYSIKFGSTDILFSDYVNSESQILYDRDPRVRVQKAAPYLTLDGRTYPAVVDGRVKWIIDGYTTSDGYPYSSLESLNEATVDSLTATSSTVRALAPKQANYIRNSVKATVDAYDGSVTLYAWDDEDPVLKTWSKIFPTTIESMSEISGDLMSHMRYPEDLFKVQRQLLTRYHVSDAGAFYSGQDFWRSPNDPTIKGETEQLQPPYYLTLQMPGQTEPKFSLMSTFIPGGNSQREILTGFLAVNAESGDKAGVRDPDYGKLRLLTLPRDATVPGPGQVQNNFNSNSTISSSLNLLERGNSTIIFGNQLTLPMGGGLLYVEPVYVQSSSGTAYPLLQKVLVAFGDKIGYADTLNEALDQVFGGDSGAEAGDAANDTGSGTAVDAGEEDPGDTGDGDAGDTGDSGGDTSGGATDDSGDSTGTPDAQLQKALQDAQQAMTDSDAALAEGDWAKYGEAQQRLKDAIARAVEADAARG